MRTLVRGEVLGSVCVIDENPHSWQPSELAGLARSVSNEIDLRDSLARAPESLLVSETPGSSLPSPGPEACSAREATELRR
jgi:hypothetical protein